MSLLDRLKPQRRWKHPDPEIRAAAVLELDDADELRAIVREDGDAIVRRAAVKRLGDVAFLAEVARSDEDERVRAEAAAGLVEIANTGEPAVAQAAVGGLTDQKHLSTVAKSSPHDGARAAAVIRLTEPRALGAVARQATDPETAMQALEALVDADELVNVAINSEHKEVALAALEKVAAADGGARETFETVAARAKHKAVARRAAALVQALDEAEAARRAAAEVFRQRQMAACEAAEAAGHVTEWRAAEAAVESVEEEWRALGPDVDAALATRFFAAVELARAAVATRREQALDAERRAEALSSERDARVRLVAEVDALDPSAADALDRLAALRQDWQALPAPVELATDEAAGLNGRFDRAAGSLEDRRRRWDATDAARARLDALSVEAEALAGGEDLETLGRRWPALAAEWQALATEAGGLTDETVAARFAGARDGVAARQADLQRQAGQSRRDNLARLDQLCQHLDQRVGAEDLKLREADRGVKNIRAALDTPPPLPPGGETDAVMERLKALHAALMPRLRELRELDDWKRFANASAQEELITQAEALKAEADLEKTARALRDLHVTWREVAEAPRDQAEALWHRFKAASDEVRAKCGEFFAQQAEERAANLKLKEALCEKAEALVGSTDWIRTADALKQLQAEWKTIGPVSRRHAKTVWKRFRAACDHFFTRRHDDLAERKRMWAANLERKQALCAQAEALAGSTDWDTAASEIRRLQAEWKTVGPVRKNRSEAIWQRFRAACDHFFDRYKHRHQLELGAKLTEREALVTDLEALAASDPAAGPPEGLGARAAENWAQWTRLPALPREVLEPLARRHHDAVTKLVETYPAAFAHTALDPAANLKKMEALCARVESCLSGEPEVAAATATPAAILAARLREALAANTIGGRPDNRHAEDARWRAAVEDVRDAQAAWRRLGPVPGDEARALAERFHKTCNRFFDQHRRRQGSTDGPHGPSGRPRR